MNLLILQPDEIDSEGLLRLTGPRARHLLQVLKVGVGGRVSVGLLDGPIGEGSVEAVEGETVALRCRLDRPPPPPPEVDLLLALPRPKVLKRLWAQLAALGVRRVLLTNAWKVERCYFDTHVIEPAFFTPLLIEGLQQARDTRLPEVSLHRRFKLLLENDLDRLVGEGRRVVLDPGAAQRMADLPALRAVRTLLAVGPEGGWTPYELDLLHAHGFACASLGDRALRTDTACIAALALAHLHLIRT